jgi:hypothetical protein
MLCGTLLRKLLQQIEELREETDLHYNLILKQENWCRNVEDNFIETLDHLIKIDKFLRQNLTPEELKIYKAMDANETVLNMEDSESDSHED